MPRIPALWVTPNHRQKCSEILLPVSYNISQMCYTFFETDSEEAPRRCCKDYDNTPVLKLRKGIIIKMSFQHACWLLLCLFAAFATRKKKHIMHKRSLSNPFPPTVSR